MNIRWLIYCVYELHRSAHLYLCKEGVQGHARVDTYIIMVTGQRTAVKMVRNITVKTNISVLPCSKNQVAVTWSLKRYFGFRGFAAP
jgi:hypothetical protein